MSTLARALLVTLTTAALALGTAGTAAAHVSVTSTSTTAGGSGVLTFKVPVESPTAHTVGLTVRLPTDPPLRSVLSTPVPGWDVELVRTTLPAPLTDDDGNQVTSAITEVTWTATAGGLAPGQFGQFPLSVSPLPAGGTLYFPTTQRYSDGSQVDWVQQAQGGAEPEHPAPSLAVTPAGAPGAPAADTHGTAHGAAPGSDAGSEAGPGDPGAGWGIGLAVTGIVLAVLAGALAGAALVRSRPRVSPTRGADEASLSRTSR